MRWLNHFPASIFYYIFLERFWAQAQVCVRDMCNNWTSSFFWVFFGSSGGGRANVLSLRNSHVSRAQRQWWREKRNNNVLFDMERRRRCAALAIRNGRWSVHRVSGSRITGMVNNSRRKFAKRETKWAHQRRRFIGFQTGTMDVRSQAMLIVASQYSDCEPNFHFFWLTVSACVWIDCCSKKAAAAAAATASATLVVSNQSESAEIEYSGCRLSRYRSFC